MDFNIDVSRLTVAGWIVALTSIGSGLGLGWCMFPVAHMLQLNFLLGGALAVLALFIGFGIPLLIGRFGLEAAGIPLLNPPMAPRSPTTPRNERPQ